VTTTPGDGAVTIALAGRLGAAATPGVAAALSEAIASGFRCISLNLEGLDYISSAGILTLEATAARLRGDGGQLMVGPINPAVRVALELAGFPAECLRSP